MRSIFRRFQQRRANHAGRHAWWIGIGLVAAVLLLYSRTAGHEFLRWDDDVYVTDNVQVRSGVTWSGVKWAFGTSHASNWHPLTWMSHMLDCEAFGLEPGGHHGVSVVLHALNALLLLVALRRMTGAVWPSALVAALFALHPLRVESVAWISERKDLLSGLFWMLTMLAYVRYARRPGRARYLVVFVLLALGLMAKPMLVTLPFVLLLLDFWPLRRVGRQGAGEGGRPVRWLVLEKLPLLGLSAASSVVTAWAQRSGGAVGPLEALPFLPRLANALVAYVAYLWKTLWPTGLACMYPHPALVPGADHASLYWKGAAAGLLLAGLAAGAMLAARRRPYLAVGWLWYLGTLVPVIGLFQVGMQGRADRYTYLPSIGIYVAIVWGIAELVGRRPGLRRAWTVLAVVLLAAYATAAWFQIGTWRNSRALFERALAVTDDNFLIHNNLGNALAREGALDAAVVQYERALEIKPDYATGHNNLGNAYAKRGELRRAAEQYGEAVRLDPGYAKAHHNLAVVLEKLGDPAGARTHLERAVRADPGFAAAYGKLGELLRQEGDLAGALDALRRAIELWPDDARAHNSLGLVLEGRADVNGAAAAYRRALQIDPGYSEAHNNLGVLFATQGRLAEAAAHFERALLADPENLEARQNLARVKTLIRKP